ncbi:MAG TPA: FtsX-like permease family protein [Streptosporangiaceae bacterium]|jgi:hypothetical protein
MIRLGLRLALSGGREAAVRLVLIAVAVALGVGLLLVSLAGINAVNAQNARYAWLSTGAAAQSPAGQGAAHSKAALWWLTTGDFFGSQAIGRIDVAATGPSSPVPPGIAHLPGPGQYYASPAMVTLLRSTPAGELAGRYPGHLAGTIGPAALPAPNSLVIIVGHTPGQLSRVPGAVRVYQIFSTPPSSCSGTVCIVGAGINSSGIDLILATLACALLFPVLTFIATATRLSAARREQRFAAMRLVGAEPRQISVISAVESTVAAAAGVAAGFGLFFALRPPLAKVPFTGSPFFTSDLSLNVPDILGVAIAVPAAAAIVARLALRRVQISPLGVTRRVTPRPPRAWRVLPLLAGLAELGYFVVIGPPTSTGAQVRVFTLGFLLIMAGLIVAGPWLTMAGARLMARRAHRPATLIAARRLADNPRAAFRAISGLVLALFVTTVAVAVIGSWVHYNGVPSTGARAAGVLEEDFGAGVNISANSKGRVRIQPGSNANSTVTVPTALVSRLESIPGVDVATVFHRDPLGIKIKPSELGIQDAYGSVPSVLISCAQLALMPILGHCPAGAQVAAIPATGTFLLRSLSAIVWPAAPIPAQRLQHIPAESIAVQTNGSTAAIERARTTLEAAYPDYSQPVTTEEFQTQNAQRTLAYEQLANVMILASLPIAGCTLAVSIAGGLTDRKRPFSLLRLSGAPLGMLRRMVALEGAVPLLVVAVVSTGLGFLASELFLKAQLGYSIRPPGAEYYGIVAAGVAASLGIIAATFPLLNRITGPEVARNE